MGIQMSGKGLSARLRRLGGWWRLWIVISASWALLVAAVEIGDADLSRNMTITLPGQQEATVRDVPYYMTGSEIRRRVEQGIKRENAYADLVRARDSGGINQQEFISESALIKFTPPKDWKPSDAPPIGQVVAGLSPLDRLLTLLGRVIGLAMILPAVMLAVGLVSGWVARGFRRSDLA